MMAAMKKLLPLLSLFIALCSIQAQDRNWSAEVNYPVSIGDDFGASNQGLIGFGLKYKFASSGNWTFGASLDGAWFSTEFGSDSDPPQIAKVRDLLIQPRFFAALPLSKNRRFHFLSGLGWTVYRNKTENLVGDQSISNEENWNSGFNGNLGLTYAVSSRWFVQLQYDYIYFARVNRLYRLIGLVKLGVGFRF